MKDPRCRRFSGLPLDDRRLGRRFGPSTRGGRRHQAAFYEFCVERGAPPLPELELIHESPWLNLYLYPAELDYPRSRPLGPLAQPRNERPRYRPVVGAPAAGGRPLIYLSLGSLGSADVALMRRLVDALARTPHRTS